MCAQRRTAMHHRTATVTLSAGAPEVFAFLADLRNLPGWATQYCRTIRRDGLRWLADTVDGERIFAVRADRATGVIDFLSGPTPDSLELFPMRILSRAGGCVVTCTYFQPLDLPDQEYERRYRGLLVELRGLVQRYGGGELHAPVESQPARFFPGFVTAKLRETVDFYTEILGFRIVEECDAYVQLAHISGAQLGVLRHEIDGLPRELINATDARGFWLSVDVSDVDAEHDRLRAASVEIESAPENKPWGERILIVRDPNGLLVHLGQKTDARPESELSILYAGAI